MIGSVIKFCLELMTNDDGRSVASYIAAPVGRGSGNSNRSSCRSSSSFVAVCMFIF